MDIFKDILPSIMETKKNVVKVENEKDYVPFVVNRALSFHKDCIFFANQMNQVPNVDGILQYQYLLNIIRSYKRRYQKWHKRETIENLEAVKEYYNYSTEKAKESLLVLSDNQLEQIKKRLFRGGSNDKHGKFSRGKAKTTR